MPTAKFGIGAREAERIQLKTKDRLALPQGVRNQISWLKSGEEVDCLGVAAEHGRFELHGPAVLARVESERARRVEELESEAVEVYDARYTRVHIGTDRRLSLSWPIETHLSDGANLQEVIVVPSAADEEVLVLMSPRYFRELAQRTELHPSLSDLP